MKIFNIIAIFIYTLIFSIMGGLLIALSIRTASLDSLLVILGNISHSSNIRLGMALSGFGLIVINISIAQLSMGRLQKQKTIAFENPNGQVTMALSTIEDYIRRLSQNIKEIKDIKSNASASKSGLEVVAKVVLYADGNMPEITERIQNNIKYRVQEMLGLEETVTVRIHVTKIVQRDKETEQVTAKKEGAESGFKGEFDASMDPRRGL